MTFFNKIKWVLSILMVFVLIVTTNLIDRNNFIRVKDSVVTIYEDRLIAKDLIFEMSKAVQEKEVAVAASDTTFFNQYNNKVNDDIQSLISRFEQTKLTLDESKVFDNLKENFQKLKTLENVFKDSDFVAKNNLATGINNLKENLDELSEIQINEGKRQMSISQKAIDTVELFTQIEIYLLVFLAIVIQIIVMYNPKQNKSSL
ncbi:chemoreceptor-like protein with four helix bundle sensory module [Jejuia pallidilutea]|uniref:Chemoreceptor-like protein with four helix bundle sensory module n=1 Tax=Jejuia pallidilutea TaxID=504487 RepID=A0A362X3T1_9FLAO|nr:MCP four helix bundle domain-containing protein [Jejuia pallidilutea]PQV51384.1 chemoreceptor-like protein with four helix bundle sensory module [Jejuia pallidilutea]